MIELEYDDYVGINSNGQNTWEIYQSVNVISDAIRVVVLLNVTINLWLSLSWELQDSFSVNYKSLDNQLALLSFKVNSKSQRKLYI